MYSFLNQQKKLPEVTYANTICNPRMRNQKKSPHLLQTLENPQKVSKFQTLESNYVTQFST